MRLLLKAIYIVLLKHMASILMAVVAGMACYKGITETGEQSLKALILGCMLLIVAQRRVGKE